MNDNRKGTDIFPRTSDGSHFSSAVFDSLRIVVEIKAPDDQVSFFSQLVFINRWENNIFTYLEHCIGKVHGDVFERFLESFYAVLPFQNPLSSSSLSTVIVKKTLTFTLKLWNNTTPAMNLQNHRLIHGPRLFRRLYQLDLFSFETCNSTKRKVLFPNWPLPNKDKCHFTY